MFKKHIMCVFLLLTSLKINWQAKHFIINLFKTTKTIGQTLARNSIKLLDQYGLIKKIIAIVKNEGSSMINLSIILKFIVSYEIFGL
jgi:hypothetical protein